MKKQHTIKDVVTFVGLGLHTGNEVSVTLRPMPENSGIVVNRTDKNISFVVTPETIVANTRNTTLGEGHVQVQTIEHFIFSFYYFGITNIRIDIDQEELPIFDGSAKTIIESIKSVGVVEQNDSISTIHVKEKITLEVADSIVTYEPSDTFKVKLTIDFPVEQIGVYTLNYSEGDELDSIGNARTFALLSEIDFLLKSGLSQIKDINCAYIVKNIKASDELMALMADRFNSTYDEVVIKLDELEVLSEGDKEFIPKELARHKLLDFLGDLYLLNRDIKGKFTINKPGHLINGKIAKVLYEKV